MQQENAARRSPEESGHGSIIPAKEAAQDETVKFLYGNLYLNLKTVFKGMKPFTVRALIREIESESIQTIESRPDGRVFIVDGNNKRELDEDNDQIFFDEATVESIADENCNNGQEEIFRSHLKKRDPSDTLGSPYKIRTDIKDLIAAEPFLGAKKPSKPAPLHLKSVPPPKIEIASPSLPELDEEDWEDEVTGIRNVNKDKPDEKTG
ncbi:hypothetical protein KJ951_00165 [Patescibacteria group bacterium]|nr:hypothetical protein [Patescibacteria group bacterium]MBU1702808.1 hypothetical protein [Patescibacteria group bacterium]MBU1953799.1 hypothetical protein [Patescibacteria group bacterium]